MSSSNNQQSAPPFNSPESDLTEQPGFEFSDWMIDEWLDETAAPSLVFGSTTTTSFPVYRAGEVDEFVGSSSSHHQGEPASMEDSGSGRERDVRERFAFKTQSEVEILDDGFKWRKYGKKKVKNSPNPRNYYKCAVEGCPVKKRVERDREDPRYVLTTYEGVHNHESLS